MAEYCQHEEAVAAQHHVGHHVHDHVDKTHDGKDKKSGLGDLDCPACHHSTGAAILHVPAETVPHVSVEPVFFHFQRIPNRSPDNPFRPPLIAGV